MDDADVLRSLNSPSSSDDDNNDCGGGMSTAVQAQHECTSCRRPPMWCSGVGTTSTLIGDANTFYTKGLEGRQSQSCHSMEGHGLYFDVIMNTRTG